MPKRFIDVAAYSVDEVARIFQVGRDTVVRLWDDRYTPKHAHLTAAKTGTGEWRIRSTDLATWIDSSAGGPSGYLDGEQLSTLEQVAAQVPATPLWWLQRAARAGRLDHVRIGRARRMTAAQVERLARQRSGELVAA